MDRSKLVALAALAALVAVAPVVGACSPLTPPCGDLPLPGPGLLMEFVPSTVQPTANVRVCVDGECHVLGTDPRWQIRYPESPAPSGSPPLINIPPLRLDIRSPGNSPPVHLQVTVTDGRTGRVMLDEAATVRPRFGPCDMYRDVVVVTSHGIMLQVPGADPVDSPAGNSPGDGPVGGTPVGR